MHAQGLQVGDLIPLRKVQHICSTLVAALVMTEGGEIAACKQLPRGRHLVGMEDGVTDDPMGSS